MKRRDARALDHKTLEEIRIRAVERVQAGESPEVVIRTLGYSRSCIYTWLALYRAGGWGALRARALTGRPMKIGQRRWDGCTEPSPAGAPCNSVLSLRCGRAR